MKDIFALIALSAVYLFLGAMEGHIWAGAAMAAATVAVVLLGKLWKNFWAKHPKLRKVGKAIIWILGIIFVIILILAGVPVIPIAVGAALLICFIKYIPEMNRKEKQKTQEFLDDFHDEMQQDVADYRRWKKLEDEKRRAARAEAEHLEDLARLWERNAQKYRTPKDIQKAREYREQANAAWRKIR